MRKLNRDYKIRDGIIGIKQENYDICRFENLHLSQLEALIDQKFIDPSETQNNSPSVEEFRTFMSSNPVVTCHGYVVSIKRDDYRTSIEGLSVDKRYVTMQLLKDFAAFSNGADELELQNDLHSWWD